MFLGFSTYYQLKASDNLIRNKATSYLEIEQIGLWLKDNSASSDVIMTHSFHQIDYYSEREALAFPATKQEFESLISSNKQIKYYLISMIQPTPEWTYSYPQNHSLTVINAYFADAQQTQPILILYKL